MFSLLGLNTTILVACNILSIQIQTCGQAMLRGK